MLTQPSLFAAILRTLDRNGIKALNARQYNAVVEGCNVIMAALAEPHKPAYPGMGLVAWLDCDETGASSRYLAAVLAPKIGYHGYIHVRERPVDFEAGIPHPHDPDDFARCVGLLRAVPELRSHLGLVGAGHGPVWAGLVEAWPELEQLYEREAPTGTCPDLYGRMREIIGLAEQVQDTVGA